MNLEDRLKRLERINTVLVLFCLALAIFAFWYAANGRVAAAQQLPNIVANSVKARSLAIINPTGKQSLTISVGDDGMVGLEVTNVRGEESIGLLSDPDGKPSLCLAYQNVCRVVLGDVYRGQQRELSIQLRNDLGQSVWMPNRPNLARVAGNGKREARVAVGPGRPK